jgi:hypothetical protein
VNRILPWVFLISFLMLTLGVSPAAAQKGITMGPYFQTLQPEKSIEDSIKRGEALFNKLGCAGCHPRGGTIGGTARDVAGNPVPVPIPSLIGAAIHYPRMSMTGFAATIGIMNDL